MRRRHNLCPLCASSAPLPQVLEVTPRPEAMRSRLALRLPPGARLRQLRVHGSFGDILSEHAAPEVEVDMRALARCGCICAWIFEALHGYSALLSVAAVLHASCNCVCLQAVRDHLH